MEEKGSECAFPSQKGLKQTSRITVMWKQMQMLNAIVSKKIKTGKDTQIYVQDDGSQLFCTREGSFASHTCFKSSIYVKFALSPPIDKDAFLRTHKAQWGLPGQYFSELLLCFPMMYETR